MSNVSVVALRRAGYKVRVKHNRDFWPVTDNNNESIMTRYEYEQLMNGGYLQYAFVGDMPRSFDYGDVVRPTGGFTLVEVTTPDGQELRGKFNFNVNRQYNKKEGTKVALLRAFRGNLPNL